MLTSAFRTLVNNPVKESFYEKKKKKKKKQKKQKKIIF